MRYDKLNIVDNLVEPHIAELIDQEVNSLSWKYDYNSRKGGASKHWHVAGMHNRDEVLSANMDWLLPIWDAAMRKLELKLEWVRVYLNAHTHGIEPLTHTDDGDYTLIYYPRMDWKKDFMGGTIVGNEIAEYVGNRLICFPAKTTHGALPVSRMCHKLRTCIVFKTMDMGGEITNPNRLDDYRD